MKYPLIVFFAGLFSLLQSQPAAWLWGRGLSGPYLTNASAVVAFEKGGACVLTAYSPGGANPFIVQQTAATLSRYDASGALLWQRALPFPVFRMAADSAGNIYLAGNFQDTLRTFNDTFPGIGGPYPFVVKLNASGNELWAHAVSRCAPAVLRDMVATRNGEMTITGFFSTKNDCDSIIFQNSSLTSTFSTFASNAMFVATYKTDGNVKWVSAGRQPAANTDYDTEGTHLALSSAGDVYLVASGMGCNGGCGTKHLLSFDKTGNITDVVVAPYYTVDFAVSPGGDFFFIESGVDQFHLKRFDHSLTNPRWTVDFGLITGPEALVVRTIVIDDDTNIYLAGGSFSHFLNAGSQFHFDNFSVPYYGDGDAAVLKVLPDGTVAGLAVAGSLQADFAADLALNPLGEMYVVGEMRGFDGAGLSRFGEDSIVLNQGEVKSFVARTGNGIISGVAAEPGKRNVIYPNPARNVLSIDGPEHFELELFNSTGLLSLKALGQQSGVTTVDISHLSPGVYFLRMTSGSTQKTVKVIKE